MAKGYMTVQEAQNVQLGQCKTAWLDDTDIYNCTSGEVVIAVQCIQDCKFAALTEENPSSCIGSTDSDNDGNSGDGVAATTLIPAGIVLYGRWTNVDLASGIAALYIAR
jgi:hypothetical protein